LQPDTLIPGVDSPQSWNRYSYVYNNPIRFNDPTGHICSDPDNTSESSGCESGGKFITKKSIKLHTLKYRSKSAKQNTSIPSVSPTPVSTPTITPASSACSVINQACHPTSTNTPFPTITATSTPNCYLQSSCIYPTLTPFGNELYPLVPTAIDLINPIKKHTQPDFEIADPYSLFWDTFDNALPLLGLPAGSISQAASTTVSYVTSAAINISNAIGTAGYNTGMALTNIVNTAFGGLGPPLGVFYVPTTNPFAPSSGYN
jgi:hypothetical protein